LQTWYSTTWSNGTLHQFRLALLSLLSDIELGQSGTHTTTPEVLSILSHWQGKQVPLEKARRHWLSNISKTSRAPIADCTKSSDQEALCRYCISGELPGIGSSDYGSVIMFCVPAEFGELSLNESFFECIPFERLIAHRLGKQWKLWSWVSSAYGDISGAGDIVQAGVNYLRGRVTTLRQAIQLKRVKVSIHHAAVEPTNPDILRKIKNLSPHTISWSNVCDYYSPQDFHVMAQACSMKTDTVHHLYSMNWVRRVKGASCMDFGLEGRQRVLDLGKKITSQVYHEMGIGDFFLDPPSTNPINIADYYIAVGDPSQVQ